MWTIPCLVTAELQWLNFSTHHFREKMMSWWIFMNYEIGGWTIHCLVTAASQWLHFSTHQKMAAQFHDENWCMLMNYDVYHNIKTMWIIHCFVTSASQWFFLNHQKITAQVLLCNLMNVGECLRILTSVGKQSIAWWQLHLNGYILHLIKKW